jgi:hypothetical protein
VNKEKKCLPGSQEINGVCILPNTIQESSLEIRSVVKECLKDITTINGFKRCEGLKDKSNKEIKTAIQLLGGYSISNGIVVKNFPVWFEKSIPVFSFLIILILLIISLSLRRK